MEHPVRRAGPPPFRRGVEVQSPTLPLPPPRDAVSVENLLNWVANTPRDRVEEVQKEIAAIRDRSMASAALHEQLFSLPCTDLGRHLLLLSIIGQLREESSVAELERFTWLDDERIFDARTADQAGPCDFSPSGILQARAVEMLVWVLQGRQDESVLRVIRDHPLRLVRIAAIDAYLFQRRDSSDAIDYLRNQVSDEDRSLVGLPRRGASTDPETFDRLADEHEARYPAEAHRPERRVGTKQDVC